ncbi:WapI family immunity protein [Nocardioides sp. CPCC 205120]|uniref:WapI family immunity protein n=1 Tax=Nocardioides sp. CPCC 205120 TaxID=3406462 RepID=UPI003B50D4CA
MTLRLLDPAGRGLELTVRGYAFPEATSTAESYDPDANWLVVHAVVSTGTGVREVTEPCLTTTEARSIVEWLRAVADGRGWASLTFTEPTLAFRLSRQAGGSAALEARVRDPRSPDAPTTVGLVVPSPDLRAAADAWEHHLADHPER